MTDSDYFAEKADTLSGLADEAYADGQMFLSLTTYRKLKELALEWDNPYYRDFATVHIGICLWHVGKVEEALAETSQVLAGLDEKDLDDNRAWQVFHGLFRWIWISLHYR